MGNITAETHPWLMALRSYRRTAWWKSLETAALKEKRYVCTRCANPAVFVRHLTFLKIGKEAVTDVSVLCQSCTVALGKHKTPTPGYLSPDVLKALQAFLVEHPPMRTAYVKHTPVYTDKPIPLLGSPVDIVRARAVHAALLSEHIAHDSPRQFRVHREHLLKHVPMSLSLLTKSLNILQKAGWITRFVKIEQHNSEKYRSCLVVTIRQTLEKPPV